MMSNNTQAQDGVLGTNVIAQIGILVHDIETVSQAYADFFGMEKPQWSWIDTVDVAPTVRAT